ncbi:MAG TPA: M23 family metallopeptidase [Terrimesophilobacter sp.]|nr:M23 family metallopeptidase [Terrimesophilobacter sp.]
MSFRFARPRPRAYALSLTSALIAGLFLVTQSVSSDAPASAEELQAPVVSSQAQSQSVDIALADGQDPVLDETVVRDGYTVTAAPPPPPPPPAPAKAAAAPVSQGALQWPVPAGTRVASPYGPRSSPCSGCSSMHLGVDFSAPNGAAVHAIAAGTVVEASRTDSGALGVYVAIRHVIGGQVIVSGYAHMQVGSMNLGVGSSVSVGQVLGRVGSTGAATGAHLHFEIRVGGTTHVDPLAWMHARLG